MGRRPPAKKERKPSPLSQTQYTRPQSMAELPVESKPEMGVVQDPAFWKRFSAAVHRAETFDTLESGGSAGSGSVYLKEGDQWLAQQHKEKRRCRVLCLSITMVVLCVIIAGAVVAWYFTKGPGSSSSKH